MNQALAWATRQPGNWHDSGNLGPDVLQRISEMASSYDGCVSAETGCGLSTIVLSHASTHHTCFTVGDGDSLAKVQAEPLFRAANVEFIIGPSQRTLPSHQFARPLHLALIDGPHGWPFPELDYYHLYPHIVPGGILVVDDIHIPTIGRMCEVLREDAMWQHVEDVPMHVVLSQNARTAPRSHRRWLVGPEFQQTPVRESRGACSVSRRRLVES